MAVKLRLVRMGKKKQPTYRVVAADSRSPRNGRFIEIIGSYEPRQDPSVIRIDNERALHWLRHGAQPTERVEKLLRISGVQKVSGAWGEHEFQGTAPPPKAAKAEARPSAAPADRADDSAADERAQAEAPATEPAETPDSGEPEVAVAAPEPADAETTEAEQAEADTEAVEAETEQAEAEAADDEVEADAETDEPDDATAVSEAEADDDGEPAEAEDDETAAADADPADEKSEQ